MMGQRLHRAGRLRPIAAGAVAVGLLAATLSACGGSAKGIGRLTASGVAQYAAAGGHLHSVGSGQMLSAGDQIQVTSGNAAIRLSPNGVLELRTGTAMTINKVPRLTAGVVLVEPGKRAVQVSAANATLVVASGAAQLALNAGLDAGLTAKVYEDRSSLQIPGNPSLWIVAPRQAILTIRSLLPIPAIPMQYHDDDAWDRRYLGTAEGLSRQLTAAANGFDAQLPANQAHDANFYQQLLPAVSHQSDYVKAFEAVQDLHPGEAPKPGDNLIALAMALRGNRGSFQDRLRQELAFKAEGADWGLVAVDQGVTDLGGVLNDVLAAIGRASLPFTTPGSGQVAFGPPPTTPPTTVRPKTSGGPAGPATTARPVQNRPGPVTAPTSTTLSPLIQLGHLPKTGTVLDPILDPLIDPLIDLLNRILAGRH